MHRSLAVSAVTRHISDKVEEQAAQGRFVLTLGGDHSISIGTLAGVAEATRTRFPGKELSVLWVDSHADINTPDTTTSGNIHGMVLSFSTGLAKGYSEERFGWLTEKRLISKQKLVYIALRDVDPGEEVILKENNIKLFRMTDVKRYGRLSPSSLILTSKSNKAISKHTNITKTRTRTVTGFRALLTRPSPILAPVHSSSHTTLMLSTLQKPLARAPPWRED